ncbi:MAG: AtpZ/AtpI family protein [Clostridiales bacterium]|nr:AtpZ/AtpI family protein [Clostridiales bacterium]
MSKELLRGLSMVTHLGFTMALCVIIGVLLGKWLDDAFGTSPWLLLVLTLCGLAAAIRSMFYIIQKEWKLKP